jgi:hypothetical protein
MNAKTLTFAAMMTAAAVTVTALGAVMPTMRLAMAALAGLPVSLVLIRRGPTASWLSFAAAAVLSLLLLPHKFSALCFAVFLGWYPIVKWLCERRPNRLREWLCKLASVNAAMAVVYFVFHALLLENLQDMTVDLANNWIVFLGFAMGNIVFVIYDFGLSQWLYKLQKYLK